MERVWPCATPMAQGRSTKIISMIKWIRTGRLSIKIPLSLWSGADVERIWHTVTARLWPWISGQIYKRLSSWSVFARQQRGSRAGPRGRTDHTPPRDENVRMVMLQHVSQTAQEKKSRCLPPPRLASDPFTLNPETPTVA